jgi:hypothetical protein
MADRTNGSASKARFNTKPNPIRDNNMRETSMEKNRINPGQALAGERLSANMNTRVKMIFTLAWIVWMGLSFS